MTGILSYLCFFATVALIYGVAALRALYGPHGPGDNGRKQVG